MIFSMFLPVIPDERHDDSHNLHAWPDADLILFMAGNQFVLMLEPCYFYFTCYHLPSVKNFIKTHRLSELYGGRQNEKGHPSQVI